MCASPVRAGYARVLGGRHFRWEASLGTGLGLNPEDAFCSLGSRAPQGWSGPKSGESELSVGFQGVLGWCVGWSGSPAGRPAGWSPSPSGASYLPEEAPLPSRRLSIDLDTNAEFTFLWKNPPRAYL